MRQYQLSIGPPTFLDRQGASASSLQFRCRSRVTRFMREAVFLHGRRLCRCSLAFATVTNFTASCSVGTRGKLQARYARRQFSRMQPSGEDQEWSAVRVRRTFFDYFEGKGHTFGECKLIGCTNLRADAVRYQCPHHQSSHSRILRYYSPMQE